VLTPDDRYAYVSCFISDEVRVIDTAANNVIAAVKVGKRPFLLEVTPDGQFVYVANQGSNNVSVIRVVDNQVVTTIESRSFANPHGIAFTPNGRYAYVTNENLDGSFEAHHPIEQGGNPGNVQVIDTATFAVIKTIEVEVDPTGIVVVER
ncbi:MAG: beta-propeller fold lactonase family protein, partial [candidate division KSB1 bacterium]|nr:beta-propeller fold lactonase family protein [candidate division KSB1 bacterium]